MVHFPVYLFNSKFVNLSTQNTGFLPVSLPERMTERTEMERERRRERERESERAIGFVYLHTVFCSFYLHSLPLSLTLSLTHARTWHSLARDREQVHQQAVKISATTLSAHNSHLRHMHLCRFSPARMTLCCVFRPRPSALTA